MIENKDQLIDIYDIWYKPFWEHGWFIAIKYGAIITLLGYFLYIMYKKYIQKNVVEDCAVVAYRNLDLLKNFHIVTERDSKDCYFSLSSIIKKYLACRYDHIFIRLTDKEIVVQAQRYMDNDTVLLLQQILQGMTFVKFEYKVAAHQKLEKDIVLIEEFIEKTTPLRDTKEM